MGDRAPGGARWRASLGDYLVILGWLALLTALGAAVRALVPLPPAPASAPLVVSDLVAFAVSVLPVWVYLSVGEAGPRAATWGKRRAGLRVVADGAASAARPSAGRVVLRNAVKLLPWQLAHVAVARLIVGADAPTTIAVTYALSLLVPAVSIAMAWRDPLRRALHDRVAGTRVVRA